MPLDESEWDDADPVGPAIEMIQEFLEKNPSQAFSGDEIRENIVNVDGEDGEMGFLFSRDYEVYAEILVERGDAEVRCETHEDDEGYEIQTMYYRAKQ